MSPRLPPGLLALPERDPTWRPWLDALPRALDALLADWDLVPDGAAVHGECAVVLPVRADGREAVLKVTWPHHEAEHEHLALRHWEGQGAVLLLRADPRRWALLLERAQPRDLSTVDDVRACEVTAGLLARLHRPAPPQLRLLSERAADWAGRLAALPRSSPVPHRLVEQATALCRAFAADAATDGTLLHADAHYGNVLAATREPWLAIDPKPLSGDPHFEPSPLLWNRWGEVVAHPAGVRAAVRRRLDAAVDVLDLDPDRARDWVVVREVVHALWLVEDAAAASRPPTSAEERRLTVAVAVAKAVQD
ncbi:aminoglycoside phosphotransferase family protein [Isoptericola sp. b441]|uniref:Aminoglycoside phosphotransferase family protein n=1 Tax=Actinotalea lenta TaxID=3064654 RepID=A0ABT9D8K0_9CELL|nr:MULTISPECIES: aminoglycoside phosphotransferase family protein [unclassified Isoptericola]MDO8106463.1 aminoglycoside phosphotransferase family protein [Isoptericola sp. b441]MDO8121821.1 aminoglycoside phosphotransferase family protein [Isoptericola sp. b490]